MFLFTNVVIVCVCYVSNIDGSSVMQMMYLYSWGLSALALKHVVWDNHLGTIIWQGIIPFKAHNFIDKKPNISHCDQIPILNFSSSQIQIIIKAVQIKHSLVSFFKIPSLKKISKSKVGQIITILLFKPWLNYVLLY